MQIESRKADPWAPRLLTPRGSEPAGSWSRTVAIGAAYVVAYVLLDFASYIHPVAPYAITPWNPPPGLSLALLLAFGLRYAPAVFVAAVIAELLVRGVGGGALEVLTYAGILAGGYTATAWLLERRLRFDARFASVRDLLVFSATAAMSALVIAVLYISAHVAAGRFAWSEFSEHALHFWVGDVIGLVVTTPFLLVHGRRLRELRWRLGGEAVLQALAIAVALAIVFSTGRDAAAKFFYLLFLPLIWIGVRRGFPGATAGLLATQIGLIVAVQLAGHTTQSVLEFQLLMLALAITGLFLGMAVSQWRHVSQTLETREAELNRAMRVAAAAEMASATAHELNQPLTAAANYLQACDIMLARDPQAAPDLSATMRKAYAEVERAGDVVRRLRDFYRGGPVRREAVQIADVLADSVKPLRPRIARYGIRLVERLADAPAIAVDRGQISMVLHNLVANAVDSLEGAPAEPREIAVEAEAEGAMVRIVVHDSGPGIAPSIAEQLFQTFATSKPTGMGLGLAISRSIVEAHGGRLWLEPGEHGARFTLTLPAAT